MMEDLTQTPAPGDPPPSIVDTTAAGPAAIRGGALRVAGYAGNVLLSVVAAAFLFRHLGVADGGRYVTVISIMGLFAGLTEAGLTAIGIRELTTRTGSDRADFLRDMLGLRIVLTSAAVVCATAFTAIAGYPAVMIAGTAIAGAGFLVAGVQAALGTSLQSQLRLGWVSLLELGRQVVNVALVIALVAAGASLLAFFVTSTPAGLVVLVPTVLLVRRDIPLRPRFRRDRWSQLMGTTLSYAAATAVYAVYFRIAIVLVSLIDNANQAGYFGASFRIVEVVTGLPQMAIGAAFPILAYAAQRDAARFAYTLQRVFETAVLIGGLIAVGFGLGAPVVIDIVAGPKFGPAADVLRIQSLALFTVLISAVFGYAMLALHKHREILLLSLSMLAVNAGLTAILASVAQARGAAAATVVGEIGLAVGGAIVVARGMDTRLSAWTTLRNVGLALLAPAALLLVPGLPSLVAVAVGVPLYVAGAYLLGAVPDELIVELRRLRPRGAAAL